MIIRHRFGKSLTSICGEKCFMNVVTSLLYTKVFFNDVYEVNLPTTNKFPMQKYRIVREGLQSEYNHNPHIHFCVSPTATKDELELTHCNNYVNRYITGMLTEKEIRKTGFPWSFAHVQRSTSSVGGTLAATRSILESEGESNVSAHLAGGTHHAFYNYGEGFCIFSDIAVSANIALKQYPHLVSKVLIIDLDVHQGNGNAVLFEKNPNVYTFSMHCKGNYFSQKQTSNLDIELEVGCADDEYLSILSTTLHNLFHEFKPDLVYFQGGVDVHKEDRLGKLSLTRDGISRRNKLVYDIVNETNCRLVVTMGGGYPKDLDPQSDSFKEIIEAHKDVYRNCFDTFYPQSNSS